MVLLGFGVTLGAVGCAGSVVVGSAEGVIGWVDDVDAASEVALVGLVAVGSFEEVEATVVADVGAALVDGTGSEDGVAVEVLGLGCSFSR